MDDHEFMQRLGQWMTDNGLDNKVAVGPLNLSTMSDEEVRIVLALAAAVDGQ